MVAATTMLAMTSCVSEDQNLAPKNEAGKGYIALNVTNDDALTTRTVNSTNPTEGQTQFSADNWTVAITGTTNFSGTVSALANEAFAAAEGYTAKVSNYTDIEAALQANDGFGDAFYEGTSSAFAVTAGATSTPCIDCGQAKNAQLKVNVSAFTNVNLNSLTVVGSNSRTVTFKGETDNTAKTAYFKADDELTFNVGYTANGKTGTISGKITLAEHTTNTLKLTSTATGLINLTISYDDAFDEGKTVTYQVDAATGGNKIVTE